jgi:hypothetical protein
VKITPGVPQAKLTVVAEFPQHFFLENIAVRHDDSMLVTVQNRKELWLVPAPGDHIPVQPALLHDFEFNTTFVAEWRPDIYLLGVADVYDTGQAKLYRIRRRHHRSGAMVSRGM